MKYRICKNGFGQYKIQLKHPFSLWWWVDMQELGEDSDGYSKWVTSTYKTKEDAEKQIMVEKKGVFDNANRRRKENNWQCTGEY